MASLIKGLLGVGLSCLAAYALLLVRDGTASLGIASVILFAGLASAAVAIVLDSLGSAPLQRVVVVTVWCILGFAIGSLPYWYMWYTYAG